jgi:Fe-S-cluster containining protein
MDRQSEFSYECNRCGRCCHNQVITLSPVDVIAIARTCGISTGEAVARYTTRRGSLLRFGAEGACVALDRGNCSIHEGRPLACRIYPLGLARDAGRESFVRLDAARGSAGVYGMNGTVGDFLRGQAIDRHLALTERYRPLIRVLGARVADLMDAEVIEPREFWRRAIAEALRQSGFDDNRIIDAMFDADGVGCARESIAATVDAHVISLSEVATRQNDAAIIAVAAVLLAVSLGYSPSEAMVGA